MNVMYKKLSPYVYDNILIEKFNLIKEYLLNNTVEIDAINNNSVNVLFSDSSFYSIGGVLLNINMDKACENFKIKSYKLKQLEKEGEKIEFITCKENIIECIFQTLTKLNYLTVATTEIQAYLNLSFNYATLGDFNGFYEIKNNETNLEGLKRLQYSLFNKKYTDFTYSYLRDNVIELNYLLFGLATMSSIQLSIITNSGSQVVVGLGQLPKIVIYYDCNKHKFYGLNVIESKIHKKTTINFSPNLMSKQQFKDYFLNFIKKNTYAENKKYVKVIGYYSKAIPIGQLQKLGISYLELLALYCCLMHFEHYIMNRITYVLVDSTVVTNILNNTKLIKKSTKLDNLSARILNWFNQEKIYFIHCTDTENLADIFSRLADKNECTFTNSFKPYYVDQNLSITPLQQEPRIKEKSLDKAKTRINQKKTIGSYTKS